MLWLASSPGPMPVVLQDLGFAPDAMTLTMDGLEISPRAAQQDSAGGCHVWLGALDYALGYGIQLYRTPHGWDHRCGWLCPDGTVTWWGHVETDIGLPQTAREALEEAVFLLAGTTDDARMETMGA